VASELRKHWHAASWHQHSVLPGGSEEDDLCLLALLPLDLMCTRLQRPGLSELRCPQCALFGCISNGPHPRPFCPFEKQGRS